VNTLVADPIKFLLKEDITPAAVDRLLHTLAPLVSLGPRPSPLRRHSVRDVLQIGDRTINLQAAELNVGSSSCSPWPLPRRVRRRAGRLGLEQSLVAPAAASAGRRTMISYEIAMGLALIGSSSPTTRSISRRWRASRGRLVWGWLPAWGILYQPVPS